MTKAKLQKVADQELKACCEWLAQETPESYINALRAARRPKPKSQAEEALKALTHILRHSSTELGAETIRYALERLREHEQQVTEPIKEDN